VDHFRAVVLADARRYEPEVLREVDWRDGVNASS
jgi:hypothetical protein